MSHRQFGFLVGLFIVWIWAMSGVLIALAAAVAGLFGYAVVRVLERDPGLSELTERFTSSRH